MILPQSSFVSLLLMLLGLVCWGSWANTFKMGGKWRFEMYYFDFAFGMMLAGAVAAFTFGSLGFDGFLFMDDVMQTGKRNIGFACLAGITFNLGNMLLLGGISIAGMAAAIPMGFGVAVFSAIGLGYYLQPSGNRVFLFGGCAVAVAAAVFFAMASRRHQAMLLEEKAKAGLLKTSKPTVSPKAVVVSLVGGLLVGISFPMLDFSRTYGPTMGSYAAVFMFALGLFFSTVVFNLFFMNLPIQGSPVEVRDYFLKGSVKTHLLGFLGGVIWLLGLLAVTVAAGAEPENRAPAAALATIPHGSAVLAFLFGVLLWKEFENADFRAKNLLALGLLLFLAGLGLVAVGVVAA